MPTIHRHWLDLPSDIPGTAPKQPLQKAPTPAKPTPAPAKPSIEDRFWKVLSGLEDRIAKLERENSDLRLKVFALKPPSQGVAAKPKVFEPYAPNPAEILRKQREAEERLFIAEMKQKRDFWFPGEAKLQGTTATTGTAQLMNGTTERSTFLRELDAELAAEASRSLNRMYEMSVMKAAGYKDPRVVK